MEHRSAKIILISKVIELIAGKYKVSLSDARDKLYSSELIGLIEDDETGLYGESPLYCLSLFEQEQQKKNSH